ncbi:hypothetical protein [Domibacillus aminovorans]|uniref:Uncharacterized protein n=1 Tax=Domibacillus aminovorans TaxID=29332 RepID=A0A177L4Y4_9BACI|nr:hypothetical protein [Domibacillus aminovorans]OAH60740.1 hypothetical protein AWH49_15480 [Domibacillus aminovorans]
MEYTWLGKKGIVEVKEKYSGVYEAWIIADGQTYYVAGIEQREDERYTAIADGYFWTADTTEEALMPLLKTQEEKAARRMANIEKMERSAASRKKKKQEEAERREAFM